jgi:hypothetical protein
LDDIKSEGDLPRKGVAVYAYKNHTIRGSYKIIDGDMVKFHEIWADLCMEYRLYGVDLFALE